MIAMRYTHLVLDNVSHPCRTLKAAPTQDRSVFPCLIAEGPGHPYPYQ